MGLLRKLVKKVASGIGAVKEEASHPGRPPTHRDSAFHPEPADKKKASDPSKPWYLDGQNDGWDDTNPNDDKKG